MKTKWEFPKKLPDIVEDLMDFMNSEPIALSLLYDLNLLPECVENHKEYTNMLIILSHLKQMKDHHSKNQ